jgi:hypothetical protein
VDDRTEPPNDSVDVQCPRCGKVWSMPVIVTTEVEVLEETVLEVIDDDE